MTPGSQTHVTAAHIDAHSIFTARRIEGGEARLVFPLVSCRYPGLTLSRWMSYVRRTERSTRGDRPIGLIDARGHYHAFFVYRIESTPASVRRLRVSHIVSVWLAGDAIKTAFHAALDALARENHCEEVLVDLPVGARTHSACEDPAALERAGYSPHTTSYSRLSN